MHTLVIPSFYPEVNAPLTGVFFKSQCKMLEKKGIRVGVIYVEQKSLKKLFSNIKQNLYQITIQKEDGVLTYRMHGLNLFNQYALGSYLWMYFTRRLIKKYIKDNGKPDIIHAHNVFNGGIVALNCLKKFNIPYVITEHASAYLLNQYDADKLKVAKQVLDNAQHSVAVSKNLAKAIGLSCGAEPTYIIPNVIDVAKFHMDSNKPSNDIFTFISVGNLLKNKGHHILIKAFGGFSKNNLRAQLFIYGDGPERENLQELIKNLELENCVFLKGKVSPDELVRCYQVSHCLVLPSFKETFGVVIIEAMACGLPVIATKSGGPEDIVNDKNGLLVEAGDVKAIEYALTQMQNEYHLYNFREIRNFICANYSEDVVGEAIINLYKSNNSSIK